MRDLVVDYGNAILDRRGLSRGRFDGFSRLNRKQLIGCLEVGRKVIRQENSIGSANSTNLSELAAVTSFGEFEY